MRTTRIQRAGLALILGSVALSLFLSSRAEAQQGNGSFTISTAPGAGGQVIPTLTWSTTPAGATCTASGDWSGTKAASGTQTLPAVTPPKNYALACTWPGDTTSKLTWTPPTQNTDASSLTNLAGYRVLYGVTASALTQTIQVPTPGASTYTVTSLTPGPWFFSVRSYNADGTESANSNVTTKTITAPLQWTASVGVKVPNPPTNLTAE